MKILLSNKFYYPKGGDCVHTIELERLLSSKGHQVAIFAIQHPLNLPTVYSKYFPSEINYTQNSDQSFTEKILRPFGTAEVKKNFSRLLDDFNPDIVHVNNIHSHLSPVIVMEAYKRGIPVVWTLHDYKLLCPRYDCLLNNKPCQLCYTSKRNVILHRCMKGSLPASFLSFIEAKVWNAKRLQKYTARFICPSQFIRQKMIQGGFNENKLTTLNNFKNLTDWEVNSSQKEDYYCFVGRLSIEKGIETLLKAASRFPQYRLKIIGSGPLEEYLKNTYSANHIEFCGQKSGEEVKDIVSKASFLVMSSEWYENNPLAVIESLCLGTPVLGANIGGIPELIVEKENGLLFVSGDEADLYQKIEYFLSSIGELNYKKIASDARQKYSSDVYYDRLLEIYSGCLKN